MGGPVEVPGGAVGGLALPQGGVAVRKGGVDSQRVSAVVGNGVAFSVAVIGLPLMPDHELRGLGKRRYGNVGPVGVLADAEAVGGGGGPGGGGNPGGPGGDKPGKPGGDN